MWCTVLEPDVPTFVSFKCSKCPWMGMLGVRLTIGDADLRLFVACPVHGWEATEAKRLETSLLGQSGTGGRG